MQITHALDNRLWTRLIVYGLDEGFFNNSITNCSHPMQITHALDNRLWTRLIVYELRRWRFSSIRCTFCFWLESAIAGPFGFYFFKQWSNLSVVRYLERSFHCGPWCGMYIHVRIYTTCDHCKVIYITTVCWFVWQISHLHYDNHINKLQLSVQVEKQPKSAIGII